MKCFLISRTNFFKKDLGYYIYKGEYYGISDPKVLLQKNF